MNKIDLPSVEIQVAYLLQVYSEYIADWAVRKEFRAKCLVCNGTGMTHLPVIDKNRSCEPCVGTGIKMQNFGEQLMLVTSELAEMLEDDRKSKGTEPDEKCPEFTKAEIECADAIIRLLDMSGAYKWRIGPAVVAKMRYNETRPAKHGKRY